MTTQNQVSRWSRTLAWLVAGFAGTGLLAYVVVRDTAEYFIEKQAIAVAEIVVTLSKTARTVYSREIVKKLQDDGAGAHPDYAHSLGYVPLPAQFLKLIGRASTESTSDLFHYKPVSKWNLDPTQGLDDDFLHWAWPQLEAQDQADPAGPIAWTPVWRIEERDGQRVLRYLAADPASSQLCADCHNGYEQSDAVIADRARSKVPLGKQWKLHQLLGALSVTVPLERIEVLAAQQIQRIVQWLAAILGGGLAIFIAFWAFNARQHRRLALLSWQATHDPLTELANRRGFERSLHQRWEATNNGGAQHVLALLDLDGFKPVNDTHGHHAGDEILRMIARILREHVRTSDVVARLGGDEFALLLDGCPLERARQIAETIRDAIGQSRLDWEGASIGVGVSIGLCVIHPRAESPQFFVEKADMACYMAKKAGKNRVVTSEELARVETPAGAQN